MSGKREQRAGEPLPVAAVVAVEGWVGGWTWQAERLPVHLTTISTLALSAAFKRAQTPRWPGEGQASCQANLCGYYGVAKSSGKKRLEWGQQLETSAARRERRGGSCKEGQQLSVSIRWRRGTRLVVLEHEQVTAGRELRTLVARSER